MALIVGSSFDDNGTFNNGAFRPKLVGTDGVDTITARAGNDIVQGMSGDDDIDGGGGNDEIFGDIDASLGFGNDIIRAGFGNDRVIAGQGNDEVFGGSDADVLFGSFGNDLVFGESGNDTVLGGDGNDRIFGGTDNDQVLGGKGDDILGGADPRGSGVGIGEIDFLTGGDGKDTFVLGDRFNAFYNDGIASPDTRKDFAVIKDFADGQDKIQLNGGVKYFLQGITFNSGSAAGVSGIGIYIDAASAGGHKELLGVVENLTANQLQLSTANGITTIV